MTARLASGLPSESVDRALDTLAYLSDGLRLYEIVSERCEPNYGLDGGVIQHVLVRDCVSEELVWLSGRRLAWCWQVRASHNDR